MSEFHTPSDRPDPHAPIVTPIEADTRQTAEALAVAEQLIADQQALRESAEKRRLRIQTYIGEGALSYALYARLSPKVKKAYTARFPRPKSPTELRAAAKRVATRRRHTEIARASRRRNRTA